MSWNRPSGHHAYEFMLRQSFLLHSGLHGYLHAESRLSGDCRSREGMTNQCEQLGRMNRFCKNIEMVTIQFRFFQQIHRCTLPREQRELAIRVCGLQVDSKVNSIHRGQENVDEGKNQATTVSL